MRDDQAKQLIYHWIYGRGKRLLIDNDDVWNEYMKANPNFKQRVMDSTYGAFRKGESEFSFTNGSLVLSETGHGGYFTGYDLLNGSNKEVGGFSLSGEAYNEDDTVYVKVNYEYNDIMDVNGKYYTDSLFAVLANISFGNSIFTLPWWFCKDYKVKISGTVIYEVPQ